MGLRELNATLTKEQVALWDTTKKFVSEVWRPASIALDKLENPEDVIARDSIYWDVTRKTFAQGYHTIAIREEWGGQDMDPMSQCLIYELMGWAAPGFATSFGCHFNPFSWGGYCDNAEIQKVARQYAEDNADAKLTGCWALTEPDHGTDWIMFENKDPKVYGQVRARLDKDEYVLNGQKAAWVSNGPIATHAAVWVTIDVSKGMQGGGVCVLPLDLPGITRGKPLHKMGQRDLPQGEIFFDDVRIPRDMMIAEDEAMFNLYSNVQLAGANGWNGVIWSGAAMAAFEEALEYAKNRVQGGKVICNHQLIQTKLADMFAKVESCRAFARSVFLSQYYSLIKMAPAPTQYAMAAKVLSTNTAFQVAHEAIQIFGGNGITKEYVVEKMFRDARLSLIEDGMNEALSLDAIERVIRGPGKWYVTEGIALQPTSFNETVANLTWEEFKPIVRPEPDTVKMGVMKVDEAKCTGCGLCVKNCPFRCWEMNGDKKPQLRPEYACFSCYNCMVACPQDAITIAETYRVETGFFDSDHKTGTVLAKLPLEPKDAKGNPDKWTETEKLIMERRSVRNFKPDPVPDELIRRVIEAGRFAPSSGNGQPWKFIVVTDKALIAQMNESVYNSLAMMYNLYKSESLAPTLLQIYQQMPMAGLFDHRVVQGGWGVVARKEALNFFDAPVVILLACDDRAAGGPQIQAGIAGQNMNLAAVSLGLGFCWNGFSQCIEVDNNLKDKLGLKLPWRVSTALCIGYPKFNQSGIVPREFRPITWFREGKGMEIETATPDQQ